MKAPPFWYHPPGLLSTLLKPLGFLYDKGGKFLSHFKQPQRFQIPILSVGNIVSGGSGKTPTAIALAQLLNKRGYAVHFVTRGYGGKEKGPLKVDTLNHTTKDVGDEPFLLAEHAPTWMAKKRSEGVRKAIENGAQLIILDDGHQTTGIYKDVSLVVVDLLQGFGNGCVIPAGPLRESLSRGLQRTDGVIVVGETEVPYNLFSNIQSSSRALAEGVAIQEPQKLDCDVAYAPRNDALVKPFFHARLIPHHIKVPTKRIIAFCGLGFPEKFYTSLENEGFELVATHSFPDHYQYTMEDLLKLQKLAQKHDCALITTRKDLIKIPPPWQKILYVLDISIKFEDPEKIGDFILQKIHRS